MSTRRIYTLLVVLGLTMVWLGFLYTYELKIADHSKTPALQEAAVEQLADESNSDLQLDNEELQTAGLAGGDAVSEEGDGFPLLLAGLGIAFVLGGAFSYRNQKK